MSQPRVHACIVPANGVHYTDLIEDSLEVLQGLVDGFIQGFGISGRWYAYCDENGVYNSKPINWLATHAARSMGWSGGVLLGDIVFLGYADENGNDTDVPQEVVEAIAATADRLQKENS